ncbi:MAG: hypothetical protein A2Y38_26360 [Spirochaetes bacterium GWB1_59_5]|nr:MAG: hypothetical protein A2Y38_26360 [Spirochaetes bacterium GWB1_59_5]
MSRPSFIYPTHLNIATAAATDTATGYAAANVLEGCEDTAWRPSDVTGAKSVIIALGGLLPIGQVAVLGQYLNGVSLEVRGSTDGFVASDVALSAAAVINSSAFVTGWRSFGEGSYSHIKLIFADMGASFEVQHIACCRAVTLPFLDDGYDPDVFQSEGTHLIGVAGTYLGATQQRSMRSLSLNFGQIPSALYPAFRLWAEYCVMTMRPFFYIPDTALPECYFGWVDAKYKFSAPFKNGLRKLAAIPFTSRIA